MNRTIIMLIGAIASLGMAAHVQAATCVENTPVTTVTTIGGGQSKNVNQVMYAEFTGYITTTSGLTSGGKNAVKICEGTTVEYNVVSTVTIPGKGGSSTQPASCVNTSASGTLSAGDKLVCNNKHLGGSDTDRYRIVGVK